MESLIRTPLFVTIADVDLYRYELPFAGPVQLDGSLMQCRRGLLVRVVSNEGHVGWGEAAPLPGFSDESLEEVVRWAKRTLPRWTGTALHRSESSVDSVLRGFRLEDRCPASLRFGWESAVLDLIAAQRGIPIQGVLGPSRSTIEVNGLIEDPLDRGVEQSIELREVGYRTVKVKVGRGPVAEEIDAVREIGREIGEEVSLRLDANQAWSVETAVDFAKEITGVEVDYLEEPLADPSRLGTFARRAEFPIALDETTRERSPTILNEVNGVTTVVLKPTLLGGVCQTRRWSQVADENDVMVVLSASYESGIGHRMLVALAATGPDVPAGLSTYDRLAADVLTPRFPLNQPIIEVVSMKRKSLQLDWRWLDSITSSEGSAHG